MALARVSANFGSVGAADAGKASGQVVVRIEVEPATATVTLEGARVSNPFSARFPKSDLSRQLRVRAEGHKEWAEWVVFDQDRRIVIRLEPVEPAAAPTPAPPAPPPRP